MTPHSYSSYRCDSDLFRLFSFSKFYFPFCLLSLKPKVAFHLYDVLSKNIMKMMKPRRLPKPATYQAWKWRKTAYPNSSESPNLLFRCKLKSLLSSQGPAHSEVAGTSSLEMQDSQMEAGDWLLKACVVKDGFESGVFRFLQGSALA